MQWDRCARLGDRGHAHQPGHRPCADARDDQRAPGEVHRDCGLPGSRVDARYRALDPRSTVRAAVREPGRRRGDSAGGVVVVIVTGATSAATSSPGRVTTRLPGRVTTRLPGRVATCSPGQVAACVTATGEVA